MNKLLTVVVCCYNSANTITDTIKSIDVLNNKDVDIFIIDDGSKDNLESVVKPFIDQYPDNIHYFKKENGNWGSCINFAIKNVNSQYMSILDSDDTYDVAGFNYVTNVLRHTQPDTDLVLCNYVWKFLDKARHNTKEINFSKTKKECEYINFDQLDLFHVITIHATIFNTRLLKQLNPLPEKVYYSDGVLIYQALLNTKKICYVNKDIHWYNYCIRKGASQSISAEKSVKNYQHFEIVYDAFLNVPFPTNHNKKQAQLAKKFICNHFYWFMLILSKNYNYTHKQKVQMIRSYYQKLLDFERTNNLDGEVITLLARIFKTFAGPILPLCNFATQYLPITFLKASRYTKEQKKRAKAEAKARKQSI